MIEPIAPIPAPLSQRPAAPVAEPATEVAVVTPVKPATVTSGVPVAGAQAGVSAAAQSDATPPPAAVVGGEAETDVKVETRKGQSREN